MRGARLPRRYKSERSAWTNGTGRRCSATSSRSRRGRVCSCLLTRYVHVYMGTHTCVYTGRGLGACARVRRHPVSGGARDEKAACQGLRRGSTPRRIDAGHAPCAPARPALRVAAGAGGDGLYTHIFICTYEYIYLDTYIYNMYIYIYTYIHMSLQVLVATDYIHMYLYAHMNISI